MNDEKNSGADKIVGSSDVLACELCNGQGWTCEPECCRKGRYGCGSRGCNGPDPAQVECEPCNGTGKRAND